MMHVGSSFQGARAYKADHNDVRVHRNYPEGER